MSTHPIHPLATAIRERRKQARISVREAAGIAGVSHSWLDKQERGAAAASPLRLEAVLRKLETQTHHSSIVTMQLVASDGRAHDIAQMAPGLLILAAPVDVASGQGEVTLTIDEAAEKIPVNILAQQGLRLAIEWD